eukprot:TRINITY_DN10220_c0_g1_i1.p1 TRINITY_DN10220_c0_g1~~TRINITY_DN10220_c0_g1_i1.p1  ORF type:complete len:155 (+),score=37.30 TRINITY_DN10220_c0_g1_i1:61-525(+)
MGFCKKKDLSPPSPTAEDILCAESDSFIGGEVRSSVVNLAKEVQDEGKKKRRKKRVPIDDEEQKQLEQHERDTLDLLLSSAEELAYALNDKSVSVSLKAASWMEVITPIPGEEKVLKSHLDGSEASIQSFDIYEYRQRLDPLLSVSKNKGSPQL